MLFNPKSYLGKDFDVDVSATKLIPVNSALYRAFVLQAYTLEREGTRYDIWAPFRAEKGIAIANCQSALSGVKRFISGSSVEQTKPNTGLHRGERATNEIAVSLLDAAGVHPAGPQYGSPADDWIGLRFTNGALGARQPAISWYYLHR
jgi:hypothetical protein